MIISRTPYRLSLFGGGTDFPAWYQRHGGSVIATSIDKYCYLICRNIPPFFDYKYRVVWSKIEMCKTLEEIQHPAVKAILEHVGIDQGVEITTVGDLPARSGVGSSSAFTVGLLNACYGLKGKMVSKYDLAMEAIHLEQNVLKENVGSQDQVSTAYGGLNRIDFHMGGEITVTPMTLSSNRINELNDHLMLFYTGIKRTSSQVQQQFVDELNAKKRQLRIMKDLVDESISVLNSSQSILSFGELLHEAWDAKKNLSSAVSNPEVDDIHSLAMQSGAIGGKITGAGGGGFLLLFVEPAKQKALKEALNQFIHVPFRFDFGGSQIVYSRQDQDYSDAEIARTMQQVRDFREL